MTHHIIAYYYIIIIVIIIRLCLVLVLVVCGLQFFFYLEFIFANLRLTFDVNMVVLVVVPPWKAVPVRSIFMLTYSTRHTHNTITCSAPFPCWEAVQLKIFTKSRVTVLCSNK